METFCKVPLFFFPDPLWSHFLPLGYISVPLVPVRWWRLACFPLRNVSQEQQFQIIAPTGPKIIIILSYLELFFLWLLPSVLPITLAPPALHLLPISKHLPDALTHIKTRLRLARPAALKQKCELLASFGVQGIDGVIVVMTVSEVNKHCWALAAAAKKSS